MWDWIISVFIIGGLILAVWAKISHQTIPELIGNMKDIILDTNQEREALVLYE